MLNLLVWLSNSLLQELVKPKISTIYGLKAAFQQLVEWAIGDKIRSGLSLTSRPARPSLLIKTFGLPAK
jgi:hypothetical protein